jgi:ABC-2 type transport system ATP-binding protein
MKGTQHDSSNDAVNFDSVTKIFRPQTLFVWRLGNESRSETRALSSISIRARRGEVLILLGANGSGKTTFLRLASGGLLPESGRVLVAGHDTFSESNIVHRIVAHAISVERSFFPRLTVTENLHFFATFEDVPKRGRNQVIDHVIAATGLKNFRDVLAMKLSSGTYQKLAIARALLKNPAVLLLDEPTRSLDPAAVETFWPIIRNIADSGTCVIVASHNLEEAAKGGDRIAVFADGKLVAVRSTRDFPTVTELRSFYFDSIGSTPPANLEANYQAV